MLKLLHTSDVHLGRSFGNLGEAARDHQLRVEAAFSRVCQAARQHDCSLLLIAGDMFDSPRVNQACVRFALEAIQSAGVPVVVIPGNHDPAVTHPFTSSRLPTNLFWLPGSEPLELPGLDLCIFPSLAGADGPASRYNVALLHVSIEGGLVEPGERTLRADAIAAHRFDYAALGDWHAFKDCSIAGCRIFYSGSPELVMPGQSLPGTALVVTVDDLTATPERITTGVCDELPPEERLIHLEEFDAIEDLLQKMRASASPTKLAHFVLDGEWRGDTPLDEIAISDALQGRFLWQNVENRCVPSSPPTPVGMLAQAFLEWLEVNVADEGLRDEALRTGLHLLNGGRL